MADKITRINLEPDKPALDGRYMEKLIELWEEDIQRKVKPNSYKTYLAFIKFFEKWWSDHATDYNWLLNENTFLEFIRYLAEYRTVRNRTILSARTQNGVLDTLKQILRWAYRSGYVQLNFSPFVPTVKARPKPRIVASIDDLYRLFHRAAASPYPIRNQAIIAVMAGTGIRCIECAALKLGDVSMTGDLVGTIRLRITKGGKPRIVAFDKFTGDYLSKHLESIAGRLPAEPLFITRKGEPFNPHSIGTLIHDISDAAGVHVRAHDLRRMFATYWGRTLPGEGYGQLLQKQLGHARFDMTSQYMLQDVQDVMLVMRNNAVSPVALLHTSIHGPTT